MSSGSRPGSSGQSRERPHQAQHQDLLTRLLRRTTYPAHSGPCDHGTFSPGAESVASTAQPSPRILPESGTALPAALDGEGERAPLLGKRTTDWDVSSDRVGIDRARVASWWEWWTYYIPSLRWVAEYRREYLLGDIVAGVTLASIYIPISFSLASNLAHLPPLHGLLSFAIEPLIYALLGSCSILAVGPEAAGSLLLGSALRLSKAHHDPLPGESEDAAKARITGIITGLSGLMALAAGVFRLGFVDAVLSRSFLRGFISAVGWVIFVDQLVPELGLAARAKHDGISEASSIDKLIWVFHNLEHAHKLTAIVAGISFVVLFLGRAIKKRLEKRFPRIIFLPDRLLVVVLSICLTGYFRWDKHGLQVLGEIRAGDIEIHNPFQRKNIPDMKESMSTAFLISILGFFETIVAAKAIEAKTGETGVSSNRELVALGVANLAGGTVQALPGFGGYGRSKLSQATGARTPLANVVLSVSTIITIGFLLPYFYYLPRAVLSSIISVIAVSLLEEAPHDLIFFSRIRGWSELGTVITVFLTTAFFSLELGIAIGVFISIIAVIRSSNRPRIAILGRQKGTGHWVNADSPPLAVDGGNDDVEQEVEMIEGVLIVKIPEPLFFSNSGQLRSRLDRLERYGSLAVHPSRPRRRPADQSRNIIFDVHGMTEIDGSGAQVLLEIVKGYKERGMGVYFSRCPGRGTKVWERLVLAGIVEAAGGEGQFFTRVENALGVVEGRRREV